MSLLCAIEPQKPNSLPVDEHRRDHAHVGRVRAAALIGMIDQEGVAFGDVAANSCITAAQQAGNAPICSGSTTCCATTSPLAFISAQEASCDSRTMVEKPVRNSEFCISCTMPERLGLHHFEIDGVDAASPLLRHDQVLLFVHPRGLAGADHGGAVELIEHRRPAKVEPDVELLALIDRAIDVLPSKRTLRVSRSASFSVVPVRLKRGISTGGTRPMPRTR